MILNLVATLFVLYPIVLSTSCKTFFSRGLRQEFAGLRFREVWHASRNRAVEMPSLMFAPLTAGAGSGDLVKLTSDTVSLCPTFMAWGDAST